MTRLPIPGGDDGTWGTVLNDYLSVELNADGTLKKASDIVTAQTTTDTAKTTADSATTTANTAKTSIDNLGIVGVAGLNSALAFPDYNRISSDHPDFLSFNGATAEYGHQITVPIPAFQFTVTTASATGGAVYQDVATSKLFSVRPTLTNGTTLLTYGVSTHTDTGAPAASGTLTKQSGIGDTTITYSAVANLNESTQPSVIYAPSGWNGYKWWMTCSGYPNGDNSTEATCVLGSNDGETFEVPAGASNPIFGASQNVGDPEIVFDSDGSMNLFQITASNNKLIQYSKSTDGVIWSTRVTAIDCGTYQPVSPTVAKTKTGWAMWFNDISGAQATYNIKMYTASTLAGPWTLAGTTNIVHAIGFDPWHQKAIAYCDIFLMYANVKAYSPNPVLPAGNYLLKSNDGLTWSTPQIPNHFSSPQSFEVGGLYKGSPILMLAPGDPYLDIFYGSITSGAAHWYEGRTKLHLNPASKSIIGRVQTNTWKTIPHTGSSAFTPTSQKLYAAPIVFDRQVIINQVAINVTTGQAGATALVGFYADRDGKPDHLIWSSTAMDASSIAVVTQTLSPTLTLDPGLYWIAGMGLGATPASYTQASGLIPQADTGTTLIFANVGGAYANNFSSNTLVTRWTTTWAFSNTTFFVATHILTVGS